MVRATPKRTGERTTGIASSNLEIARWIYAICCLYVDLAPRRGDLTGHAGQVTRHVIRVLSEFIEGVAACDGNGSESLSSEQPCRDRIPRVRQEQDVRAIVHFPESLCLADLRFDVHVLAL